MGGDKARQSAASRPMPQPKPEKKEKRARGGFYGAPEYGTLNTNSSRRGAFLGG